MARGNKYLKMVLFMRVASPRVYVMERASFEIMMVHFTREIFRMDRLMVQ